MKPTHQDSGSRSRRDSMSRPARRTPSSPKTDYAYHATSATQFGGRCKGTSNQSFRAISRDYFKKEARQTFVWESGFFALIVMTAALPILHSASALLHMVRAIGI